MRIVPHPGLTSGNATIAALSGQVVNLSPIFPFIIWGQGWPTALFCIQSKTTAEVRLDDNETRISGARRAGVIGLGA